MKYMTECAYATCKTSKCVSHVLCVFQACSAAPIWSLSAALVPFDFSIESSVFTREKILGVGTLKQYD